MEFNAFHLEVSLFLFLIEKTPNPTLCDETSFTYLLQFVLSFFFFFTLKHASNFSEFPAANKLFMQLYTSI